MSVTAKIDLSTIPEDQHDAVVALLREHAELTVEAASLKDETAGLKDIIKRLEHLVAELNHVVHGKKSEKLSEDERQLAFEDLETAVAEVEEQKDTQAPSDDKPRRKKPPARRNRGNLPENLPRIEQVVEPDSLECPCGCGQMHKIGEAEEDQETVRGTVSPTMHRAAGHRAGPSARDRHCAPQVCVPGLHRWRHPGPGSRAPHRRWPAH